MAIAMCALSLTVCEIFEKHEQYKNFDLENEEQGEEVEERNLRHSTGNVGIYIDVFFSIFNYLATYV